MNRRRYLALAGGALALAGCMDTDDAQNTEPTNSATASPTATATSSPTSTPTASATPETRPEVEYANLVSEFNSYGDVREKKIESATAGDYILVGFHHRYYVHDGTYHVYEQVDVVDENLERMGTQTYEDEQIFEYSGYSPFEHALAFDTRGWDTGTYGASVRVRDEVTGKVSNEVRFGFDLE